MYDDANREELLQALRAGDLLDWNEWRDAGGGPEVSLAHANLAGLNLRGANLSEVDLSNADLSGANLHEADLTGANLSGANLSNANLSDALLTDCNLIGANLNGANLENASLEEARTESVVDDRDHARAPDSETEMREITFLFDAGALTPHDMVEVIRSMSRALGVELEVVAVHHPPTDDRRVALTLRKVA